MLMFDKETGRELWDLPTTAQFLGKTIGAVRSMRWKGKLNAIKDGKNFYFFKDEVLKMKENLDGAENASVVTMCRRMF